MRLATDGNSFRRHALPGVLLLLGGCAQNCPIDELRRDPALAELYLIQRADPDRSLESAWNRGDKRFLGIQGPVVAVPGVDVMRYDELIYEKQGVRVIEGTTDFAVDDNLDRLITGARRYAAAYNSGLLARLTEGGKP